MRVFYYRGKKPNFGDDLNELIWPHILPSDVLAAEGVVVIGIGSILSEEWVGGFGANGEQVIVLGSGTSYDLPPRRVDDWSVLAVRGPLTASLIGRPEAEVTDGAILLANAPELVGPERTRDQILFMPHHRSIRRSPWAELAAEAGMTYVSPQQPVDKILTAYSRATLVVTEAMHGAIVADTLRIPWVPVTIAPTVDEFKWRDWCLSMDVPYAPLRLEVGDARDALRYRRMGQVLRSRGLQGHRNLEGIRTQQDLLAYFGRRFDSSTKSALLAADRGGWSSRGQSAIVSLLDRTARSEAVSSLKAASHSRAFLSSDRHFTNRLNQMNVAVAAAINLVRAG